MRSDRGFPPLVGAEARVLVLGSLPGKRSIAVNEYYAHPQNAFWRIMGELFDAGPELPYDKRVARLIKSGIALWDVLAASARPGSLDASIRGDTAVCNDFRTFLGRHDGITSICFNGKKASELFARRVAPQLPGRFRQLTLQVLPSTSPAHAAMPYGEKLRRWSIVKAASEPPG